MVGAPNGVAPSCQQDKNLACFLGIASRGSIPTWPSRSTTAYLPKAASPFAVKSGEIPDGGTGLNKPEEKAALIRRVIRPYEEMYLAGLTTWNIAELLGVGKSTVKTHVRALGITRSIFERRLKRAGEPLAKSSLYYRARKIYKRHHGVQPSREQHVHHKDRNPANNSLDNLELKEATLHLSEHRRGPEYGLPHHKRASVKAWLKAHLHERRKGGKSFKKEIRVFTEEQKAQRKAYLKEYRKRNPQEWKKGGKYYYAKQA